MPSNGEWEEKYSDKHKRKYWRHKTSGKTSWTQPEASSTTATSTPASGAEASDEWEEKYSDKHKRKYWRHKTSGKTSWTQPESSLPAAAVKPVVTSAAPAAVITIDQSAIDAAVAEAVAAAQIAATESMAAQQANAAAETAAAVASAVEATRAAVTAEMTNDVSVMEVKCADLEAERHTLRSEVNTVRHQLEQLELKYRTESGSMVSGLAEASRMEKETTLKLKELEVSLSKVMEERDSAQRRCGELENKSAAEKAKHKIRAEELNKDLKDLEVKYFHLQSDYGKACVERDIYTKLYNETEFRHASDANRMRAGEKSIAEQIAAAANAASAAQSSATLSSSNGGVNMEDYVYRVEYEQTVRKMNAEAEIKVLEERARSENALLEASRKHNDVSLKLAAAVAKVDSLTQGIDDMKEKYEEMETRYYALCGERDAVKRELYESRKVAAEMAEEQDKLEKLLGEFTRQADRGRGSKDDHSASTSLLREVQGLVHNLQAMQKFYEEPLESPPPDVYMDGLDVVYDDLDTPPPSDDENDEPTDPPPDFLMHAVPPPRRPSAAITSPVAKDKATAQTTPQHSSQIHNTSQYSSEYTPSPSARRTSVSQLFHQPSPSQPVHPSAPTHQHMATSTMTSPNTVNVTPGSIHRTPPAYQGLSQMKMLLPNASSSLQNTPPTPHDDDDDDDARLKSCGPSETSAPAAARSSLAHAAPPPMPPHAKQALSAGTNGSNHSPAYSSTQSTVKRSLTSALPKEPDLPIRRASLTPPQSNTPAATPPRPIPPPVGPPRGPPPLPTHLANKSNIPPSVPPSHVPLRPNVPPPVPPHNAAQSTAMPPPLSSVSSSPTSPPVPPPIRAPSILAGAPIVPPPPPRRLSTMGTTSPSTS